MKTLFKAVSVAAGVSVAALVGFASAAQAQEEVHIQVSDLDLNSPADAARFNARVDRAASQMCVDYRQISTHEACVAAVRDEANANLSRQLTGQNNLALAAPRP
jgi:UrcA family protein